MERRDMDRYLEQWQTNAKDLRRRMILSPTPRERERWYAMLLLAQGWTASATAEALERDPHTLGRWVVAFGEGGPRALIFEQRGGSPRGVWADLLDQVIDDPDLGPDLEWLARRNRGGGVEGGGAAPRPLT